MTAIQARIAEFRTAAAARVGLSVERILKEMMKIAFANSRDFVAVITSGDASEAFEALTPDQTAAVAEFQTETAIDNTLGPGLPRPAPCAQDAPQAL